MQDTHRNRMLPADRNDFQQRMDISPFLHTDQNRIVIFTFVEDIAEGVIRSSDQIAEVNPNWDSNHPDPATSNAPFRIFNIGNNNPVQLMRYINALEDRLGKKAVKEMLPMQPGDVPAT